MKPTKTGTVALIISYDGSGSSQPVLIDSLSDDAEIAMLEAAIQAGEPKPLQTVYDARSRQAKEDEEFGNYVEELLSQPFVRPEIQEHGLQWLRSKMRIEDFQKSEKEATQVITQFAFKTFQERPTRVDFTLAGPKAKVRIKIVTLPEHAVSQDSSRVA
jgi:hypothetical protein